MGIKGKLLDLGIKVFSKTLSLNKASRLSCSLCESFDPVYTVSMAGGIKRFFSCPNNITRWRLETYFTKEPETIEWIDTFKDGEVLFDIGANIGLYSIYAAAKDIKILAFEPESQNYALLNKNVYLNNLQDKIMCLNIALSDKDCFDYIYLPTFQWGGAANCFGDAKDEQNKSFKPVFKQGVPSYTLDSFLSKVKHFPTHIKIDVDGIEPKIITGADKTLKDTKLKSLLIEINEESPEHLELLKKVESNGFRLRHKKHADMFEGGKYSNFFNYVFVRR